MNLYIFLQIVHKKIQKAENNRVQYVHASNACFDSRL